MKILSRKEIRKTLTENPKVYNAILINEPQTFPHNVNEFSDLVPFCKESFYTEFNDTNFPTRQGAPTLEDIKSILEWAKTIDEPLLVACRAGISRSAAIAYLVECQKSSPEKAIQVLETRKHSPNELIIKYGIELLGRKIVPPIREFFIKNQGYCLFD